MFIPRVSARLYRPVALALEARGIASEPVFAEFGMPPPATANWDQRMPLPQIAGIWTRLLEVTEDPQFALRAADHVDLTTCDVITYLEANAKTLREALLKKFEYLPLITDAIEWTLEVEADEALLTLHERPARPPLAPVAEYLLAARQIFLRRFGPRDWRLRSVSFRHESPDDTALHESVFGIVPDFGRAVDQLTFDASFLDAPMARRDDALADLLERYADQARGSLPNQTTLSGRLEELLRSGVDPGVSAAARRLGVAVRTLQRTLMNEGTTYAMIATHTRRAAAERLLRRRELAISEVAFALGFSDVPAFHRAFVRWTGATPGEYRAGQFGTSFAEPSFGRLGLAAAL